MKKNIPLIILFTVIAIILFLNPFYILTPVQQAVVIQLGKPVRVTTKPGLYLKIPLMQEVRYFDNRLLDYDSAATEVLTKDKKNLLIDNYAKWKIIDPLLFLQTVRTQAGAQSRLDDIIYSELRVEMGRHNLIDVVSKIRGNLMDIVTKRTNDRFKDYGISVADVRIKRADLPEQNAQSIYNRMKAERERIAKEYRSEGAEEATKIRAETDKEKAILLALAYKDEQKIRGEGDGAAVKIYAKAYKSDPEFYAFIRSLESYKKSFQDNTTILLPPEADFMKYLLPRKGSRR